jgi:hypothetical protein
MKTSKKPDISDPVIPIPKMNCDICNSEQKR